MRAWLLAVALVSAAAALFFARPHSTTGPPMRDFEAYYAAGAAWNAGDDPYSQAIWPIERRVPGVSSARYEALPFVAPPAVLPLFDLLAKLPFAAANALWRGALSLCVAALAYLALRFTRLRATSQSVALIALAAIGFGPLTSALALGQLALPAMLLATLAILFPACALLAWIQPNVGLALLSQAFSRRGAVAVGAGIVAFVAACVVVAGIPGLLHYAGVLHRHSLAERFSAIQLTPASVAYGFGATPAAASTVGIIVALAAASYWIAAMRACADPIARFCITCALLPLAMPFFHEHDLIVLFVPAIVYAVGCEERLWPLAACGALLAGTDWLGLAQRPDAALQTLLLVTALACAVVAMRERIDARTFVTPTIVLALLAVTALIAHAHPAPVWPDAMGALPQNIGSLDIAAAWNAQQHAAGLFAQQPAWALLRLLSLAGCALTAIAVRLSSKSPADSRSPSPVPA